MSRRAMLCVGRRKGGIRLDAQRRNIGVSRSFCFCTESQNSRDSLAILQIPSSAGGLMSQPLHFDLAAAARRSMIEHGFEPDFPPAVAQQLEQLRRHPPARSAGARDLRHLLWSSIDNDTFRHLGPIEAIK